MRVEWVTVGLIALCYGAWLAAGLLLWPVFPPGAIALMILTTALHSSLMHECLHGHPTRNRNINEMLVGLAIGLVWPYRRFRAMHLTHHDDERLTDPIEDPESYYRALWQYRAMHPAMKAILAVNNTMLGRMVLGPLLGVFALVQGDLRRIRAGERRVLHAWLWHLAGAIPVLLIVGLLFDMSPGLYLVAVAWPALSIISIRTYAEHRWLEQPDMRTIIVERSPLSLLFLNNNLHIVHHRHPTAPWYRLPALYRTEKDYWQELNGGYVYPGYGALFRQFAFRQKEPVPHPAWHRDPPAS